VIDLILYSTPSELRKILLFATGSTCGYSYSSPSGLGTKEIGMTAKNMSINPTFHLNRVSTTSGNLTILKGLNTNSPE
jgi:hypothetical protein